MVLQTKIDRTQKTQIDVDWEDPLDGLMAAMDLPTFNPKKDWHVVSDMLCLSLCIVLKLV